MGADDPARVLIVDDNSTNRKKLALAVKRLGHTTETAQDGEDGLAKLRESPFDAVLLDIVMPGLDGFGVLDAMKADPDLRDIPVIVVSALDEEIESVVRAIELGAEDFLPKTFDPVFLHARLGASLQKKRFRDTEREHMRRVDRLIDAAEQLESGDFGPGKLDIDDIADRDDALGRFAAVFRGMAEEIYDREKRLRRNIRTLQGAILVLAVGAAWGLLPALARLSAGLGSNPIALGIWVNAVSAVVCLSFAAYRGSWMKISFTHLRFILVWAIIAGVLQRMVTFWVTEHVEAAMLSLVVTTQGFMVFVFAAAMKLEAISIRRSAGLLLGLSGVLLVLLTRGDLSGSDGPWLLVALILPFLFALESILIAARRPDDLDMYFAVGLMMGLSAIVLAVVALVSGQTIAIGSGFGRLEVIVVLMGLVGAISVLLAFHLLTTTGAVFASQSAYSMTIAGIVWGMLLLNEALSPTAWIGLALVLGGVYLVEPKGADDSFKLSRPLGRRRT